MDDNKKLNTPMVGLFCFLLATNYTNDTNQYNYVQILPAAKEYCLATDEHGLTQINTNGIKI